MFHWFFIFYFYFQLNVMPASQLAFRLPNLVLSDAPMAPWPIAPGLQRRLVDGCLRAERQTSSRRRERLLPMPPRRHLTTPQQDVCEYRSWWDLSHNDLSKKWLEPKWLRKIINYNLDHSDHGGQTTCFVICFMLAIGPRPINLEVTSYRLTVCACCSFLWHRNVCSTQGAPIWHI